MSFFTMSLAQREAAQIKWQAENNALLQMSCFTRLMAVIHNEMTSALHQQLRLKADAEGLRSVNEALSRALEAWRQAEPSLLHTTSDEFSIEAFLSSDDVTKLEVTLNEPLLALNKGEHNAQMLAPTSPFFVGEAMRQKMSPMTLWKQRHGDARF